MGVTNESQPMRQGDRLPVERKWWTMIAVSVANFMLLLDIAVVIAAQASIREDLGASFNDAVDFDFGRC